MRATGRIRARGGLGIRPGWLLCAVVAGFFAAPGAAHADDAQVTVVAPGGAQQTLSLDALSGGEDVTDRTYSLRGPSGESAQTVTGFSLAAILEAAGADPYGFSYLEAQRPAGGAVLLSRHRALDPGAFADGPPVVYATGAGTGFLRPSGGAEDLNAGDSFEAPQGVTIVLRKGSPLQVRAEASTPARDRAARSPSPRSSTAPAPASSSPTPGTSTTVTRRPAPTCAIASPSAAATTSWSG